ncbi:hypothetical protein HUK80_10850 [Flavobacterium sp. MAH-1]|uniref:Uncharacterized protein n=1 Tax=Flavobacterium agri TaxID=2743471 RepID=A0A7Y8Y2R9_9FLAO|nr:hypothetical protein [Flavobacterium agri]NUY81397.1 hypothetical protein [Flavobacterium agri]NYA71421.1 hypothetical protein [Flavobacterium agri]
MKLIASILCLFVLASADLTEIRKMYPDASKTEESAKAFHEKLAAVADNDANKVLVAYKGASETLLSKYGNTLGKKTKHMKAGASLIDAAVAAESDNIEIRMVRLSVQESVPKIVRYKKNIKEDKAFIAANYGKSGNLKEYIKNFILRSKSFSDEEKKAYK